LFNQVPSQSTIDLITSYSETYSDLKFLFLTER